MFEEIGNGPVLAESPDFTNRICRCGTPIPAGRSCLTVRRVPESLAQLLASARFCSLPCVRAYFLEELGRREATAAPGDSQVPDDLRWTYLSLAGDFARLIDDWALRLRSSGGLGHSYLRRIW